MTEATIIKASLPEVTIEELFTAQGADTRKRPPRPGMVEINRRLLEEALALVTPMVMWREIKITGVGEQELRLEEGSVLKSKLLAKVAGTAESLILFAMTIGPELDARVKEYSNAGMTLEAFVLDSAGSVIMAKVAMNVMGKIEGDFKSLGLSTTFPLGPGHSYWTGLDDVRTIINQLHGERIGISLTESNLMLPKKSIAMVMALGHNLPDFSGKTHCDFCHLKGNCSMQQFGENC